MNNNDSGDNDEEDYYYTNFTALVTNPSLTPATSVEKDIIPSEKKQEERLGKIVQVDHLSFNSAMYDNFQSVRKQSAAANKQFMENQLNNAKMLEEKERIRLENNKRKLEESARMKQQNTMEEPPMKAFEAGEDGITLTSSAHHHTLQHGKNRFDYQGRKFNDVRLAPEIYFENLRIKSKLDEGEEDFDNDDEEEEAEEIQYEYEAEGINPELQQMLGNAGVKRFKSKEAGRLEYLRRNQHKQTEKIWDCKRVYSGPSGGIHRLRLWAHLGITASMDGTISVWDLEKPNDRLSLTAGEVANENGAIRSYYGHTESAVKDVQFRSDGARFVSVGYDGKLNQWDTETGQVITCYHANYKHHIADKRISMNACRYRPHDEECVVAACSDTFLRHWDFRQKAEAPAQKYSFHQSSVASISFCDSGNKFCSTGDDRKILFWNFGVAEPIKIFSETWYAMMPTVATHPSTHRVVSVGMDNAINSYNISPEKITEARQRRLEIEGFVVAPYSCEPSFNLDGNLLACGSANGNIWVFKNKRVQAKINTGSTKPITSVQYHPCYKDVIIAAGWDGRITWWQ